MTETFSIVPASLKGPLAVLVPVALVLLVVLVVLGSSVLASQSARFEVSAAGLRLRGDLYGRLVPANTLIGSRVRSVDLRVDQALAPKLRTWGTGLPGYRSGWFRLRNGEKALVYLTDSTRVVYAPTTEGWSVLVSTPDPDHLAKRLRVIAGAK